MRMVAFWGTRTVDTRLSIFQIGKKNYPQPPKKKDWTFALCKDCSTI